MGGEEHPNPRNPYLNLSTKLYINLVKLIVSQTFLPNHQEKKLASWGSGKALKCVEGRVAQLHIDIFL